MNRPLLGRIASLLFVFAAIGFAVLVAWSALGFPDEKLLLAFRGEYALKNGFALFVDALVPLCAAAIAVAASFAGSSTRRTAESSSQPFSRIAGSTIVAFIVIAAAYAFLFEVSAPATRRRLADMEYQSSLAREFHREAVEARKGGDWARARDCLARYLAIDKGNKAVESEKLDAEVEAARQSPASPAPAPRPEPPTDVDASAYVKKAQYYFDREDWFSAHFYATQAQGIDPRRSDAPRLAARAWQKITGGDLPAKDLEAARLFRQKRDAYTLLQTEPVAAYYRFVDLAARYPKDVDIGEYLARSTEAAQKISFFREEVEEVAALPGARDILFFNPVGNGAVEAVFIGRMIDAGRRGVYLADIEAIRVNASGGVAWHLRAPYGRVEESAAGWPSQASASGEPIQGRAILLLAIDRTDRARQAGPVYIAGSRPAAERTILPIAPRVSELAALSTGQDSITAMGLPELWRLREPLSSFGMLRERIETELVMKGFMPFAFLTLSFLGLALGWAFRARYAGRPPVLVLLFVPLVPAAAALASLLYVHAHRIVLGFAVLAFGLIPALIVGAALALVLLVVSLLLTAGQAS